MGNHFFGTPGILSTDFSTWCTEHRSIVTGSGDGGFKSKTEKAKKYAIIMSTLLSTRYGPAYTLCDQSPLAISEVDEMAADCHKLMV